jgi:hypothetical protein
LDERGQSHPPRTSPARFRDRYPAVVAFALVPDLVLTFDPVLARLDALLEDDGLFQAVKADLARRRPSSSPSRVISRA